MPKILSLEDGPFVDPLLLAENYRYETTDETLKVMFEFFIKISDVSRLYAPEPVVHLPWYWAGKHFSVHKYNPEILLCFTHFAHSGGIRLEIKKISGEIESLLIQNPGDLNGDSDVCIIHEPMWKLKNADDKNGIYRINLTKKSIIQKCFKSNKQKCFDRLVSELISDLEKKSNKKIITL